MKNIDRYEKLENIVREYIKISIRLFGEKELINKNKLCNHMLEDIEQASNSIIIHELVTCS